MEQGQIKRKIQSFAADKTSRFAQIKVERRQQSCNALKVVNTANYRAQKPCTAQEKIRKQTKWHSSMRTVASIPEQTKVFFVNEYHLPPKRTQNIQSEHQELHTSHQNTIEVEVQRERISISNENQSTIDQKFNIDVKMKHKRIEDDEMLDIDITVPEYAHASPDKN